MTNAAGSTGAQQASPGAASPPQSWEQLRENPNLQFEPVEVPPPEPPDLGWLEAILEWISNLFSPVGNAFAGSWTIIQWAMIAVAALAVIFIIYRVIEVRVLSTSGARPSLVESEWQPDQHTTLALLEDADRLAAEGKFDEATHMLLQRSVAQIAAARPDWVEPSSTARELAALSAMPEAAQSAFSIIAERVERSMFALRPLDKSDWERARSAYANFALEGMGASG